jgi:hypothetical protein
MASTSVNEIYGQIGAAKIFSQDVSSNLTRVSKQLNYDSEYYNKKAETYPEGSKEQKRNIRKAKMAKKANNVVSSVAKTANNTMEFLSNIMEMVDIGKDKLIEWLTQYLNYALPGLEYSVKIVLLTNIKQLTACSIDPTIPDEWRTDGVIINEKEIDPRNVLNISPFSKIGQYNYTVESGTPLYSLARHDDMNAFIWFTKTNGKFANPNIISKSKNGLKDFFDGVTDNDTLYTIYEKNGGFKEKSGRKFLPGSTFKQSELSKTIFLLLQSTINDDGETVYIIKPVSSNWDSVNRYWEKKKTTKPLFNLSYSNAYNSSAILPKNNFTFKILPKPFQIGIGFVTDITNTLNNVGNAINGRIEKHVGNDISGLTTEYNSSNISNITFKNLKNHIARFGCNGEYSKSGKYSIDENYYTIKLVGKYGLKEKNENISSYSIAVKGYENEIICYLWFDSFSNKFYLAKSNKPSDFNNVGGDSSIIKGTDAFKVLTECYFGKTVYSFNYDYIFSFQLFDAKTIVSSIVNDLMNINYKINNPFKKNKALTNTEQIYIDNYVDQLVQNIISDSDSDNEFSNCFYNFDNNEYKSLEQSTISKIQNGMLITDTENSDNIQEVYDLTASYSTSSSQEEQTTLLKNIFNKADGTTVNINVNSQQNSNISDNNNTKSNSDWIEKIVKYLTAEIVNSILTPKVLMLIQVNKKLMQNNPMSIDKNYNFGVEDVLNSMSGIIKSIVREIVESIQKELLRMILARINEIMSAYLKVLSMEYAKKWINLLKILINAYKKLMKRIKLRKSSSSSNNSDIDDEIAAILAEVNYADITDNIIPNTNEC